MTHRTRARTRAIARSQQRPSLWPAWVLLAAIGLACSVHASYGQTGGVATDAVPPATSRSAPAEIQPGHPAPPATATGPQSAVPAPTAGADTPGGSAHNGVIAPPALGADPGINKGAPSAGATSTVIPPPGSPGGNPTVQPK